MHRIPKIQYVKNKDVHIAYQVVGNGPMDMVFVPGWVSNIEMFWESPIVAEFLTGLSAFTRLIMFDKRGTGLSDRLGTIPDLETRMDDVRAVMDAVGSERATLCGYSEGGTMSCLFAAMHPSRTTSLIIIGGFPRRVSSADYPHAPLLEDFLRDIEDYKKKWGGPARIEKVAPSLANDPAFCDWYARFLRNSASPASSAEVNIINAQIDIRHVLPSIQVPTLLLHALHDKVVSIENGRYMAQHIPNAKWVELPGVDHIPWGMDSQTILTEISEFLTGERPNNEPDRILATLLFTDIVGSTETAARLGDHKWGQLLEQHHSIVRRELNAYRGRELDTTGDGFLAMFDGPARAVRCAHAISTALAPMGLKIRAGIHTGECEMIGDRVGGIAVHIGSRVADLAKADEVLVSSTVRDLVAGSGIIFEAQGTKILKGVPGEWSLFRVTAC